MLQQAKKRIRSHLPRRPESTQGFRMCKPIWSVNCAQLCYTQRNMSNFILPVAPAWQAAWPCGILLAWLAPGGTHESAVRGGGAVSRVELASRSRIPHFKRCARSSSLRSNNNGTNLQCSVQCHVAESSGLKNLRHRT